MTIGSDIISHNDQFSEEVLKVSMYPYLVQ